MHTSESEPLYYFLQYVLTRIFQRKQLFVLLRYITPTPLLLSYLCVGENISESSLEKLLKRQPKK